MENKIINKRKAFMQELRLASIAKGLSQSQLGAIVGDSRPNVNHFLSAKKSPTLDKLIAYADVVDMEMVLKPKSKSL